MNKEQQEALRLLTLEVANILNLLITKGLITEEEYHKSLELTNKEAEKIISNKADKLIKEEDKGK
jgi:hypothetical protein